MRRSGTATRWMKGVWVTWLSVAATAVPAQAQGSADPNPVFRAIFRDDTGVVMWPYGDLASRCTPETAHAGA